MNFENFNLHLNEEDNKFYRLITFNVQIPRPRDRKTINHNPNFRQLRREIIEFMLESKRGRHTAVIKKLVLPDIEPEDPNRAPLMFGTRPRRRNEVKEETVEVS